MRIVAIFQLPCCVLLFCDPVNHSSPSSSVHGTFRARILEWVAISFSRGYSQSWDWIHVSCPLSCRQILYHLATGKALHMYIPYLYPFILQWAFQLLPELVSLTGKQLLLRSFQWTSLRSQGPQMDHSPISWLKEAGNGSTAFLASLGGGGLFLPAGKKI